MDDTSRGMRTFEGYFASPNLETWDDPMFSHIHVGIADFARSYGFYRAVLGELEIEVKIYRPDHSWAAWGAAGSDRPLFFIGLPFDRNPTSSGNGNMTAFLAPTRKAVDRCHAAAVANGGRCDGAPGLRPQYHVHYYGAYFRDPDGNKICVCCHDASEATEDAYEPLMPDHR